MIDFISLYKENSWNVYNGNPYLSDYQPMVDAMGEVIIQVDDNDYQGDTRVLLRKGSQYGVLIFGWGSCSGCDALQSCDTWEDVQELGESLENSIRWFDDLDSLKAYWKIKYNPGEYFWHKEESKKFFDKLFNYEES